MRITSSRSLKVNEDDKPIARRLRAYIEPVDCTWFENLKSDLSDCLRQVIKQYQLEKAWFSDKFNFFAHNDEISFILNRSGILWVYLL